MGTNEIGGMAADGTVYDRKAAAARWNDPKLAAQALLSGRAPFLADSLTTNFQRTAEPRETLESAATVVNAAATSRWSDPQLAAQALLSGTVPFLADGFATCLGQLAESRPAVGNARESISATATAAAASRWSDPK